MNFGDVIQAWKEDCHWIDGRLNPYVMKDMTGVLRNPAVHGEVIAQFTILDKTIVVNGEVVEYQKEMEYHSYLLNGTEEEKELEVARLQRELKDFTNVAIAERKQQIDDLRNAGNIIMTTNPYEW